MKSLGKKLRRLRKENRWTLAEVAEKLNLRGHSTYSNWEYDRTEPDTQMLSDIAKIYGTTTDYLLGRTEDPKLVLSDEARQIIDIADLTDEDIENNLDFDLELDGKALTKEEVQRFILFVRAERQYKNGMK